MLLPRLARAMLVPLTHAAFRPDVEGREHIPRDGAVILAANHLSFLDSFLIPLVAPRPVAFLAKQEYFTGQGPRGWLTRTTLTAVGAVAVPRGAHRAAQEALETALRVLKDGRAFGIHPEGSRSRDGRLYRGRTGVAWLALASGAPVVPVAVLGTDRVQPVGARLPRPGRVTVRFGEPLRFGPPVGTAARARREATDHIMDAIAALSGQERADEYNALSGTH
ncbi:lysophospholipid acyltransferase family protein [Couchioplanes caeruleus]|uniref:Acyl-phosphate glycerol 3-phosphate acyltransferase n=2 Tax=Couchioplanes caeruleus TaxID=56438 RepID=A0A1K0FHJ8_9ACTN|nr:lysophospholipid acyltransferase family protein [Couchioplanes caeruleus]OJF12319.1 acyl-phosphate glycerol 3-phosphate acyltransferase [Couchioplanes caeruleus subsp. caeruleus]ROP34502.1 1-acyl-sn-glycerol-3-phosphate acyltransferase [Couchioplanes caeruleus]